MALVKAKLWIEKTFALDSQPTPATIRSWIVAGEINGKIINGNCFIEDSAPFKAPENTKTKSAEPQVRTGSVMRELARLGIVKQ